MNARADWGGVSRPSSQAWIATGSSCRWPSMMPAVRCWSSACTPPFPIRPSRWSVPPRRRTLPHNSATAGSRKNAPDSIAWEMRTMSWGTTRPAPRFRCPTSLLPICPSGTMRTTGVRGPCLFAILEGMQSSRALRALPVVLWLAPTPPLIAQARYRVTTDGAWFYQEAGGKRLARLARGAVVSGGDQQGDWQGVTLEGWIFTTSVGPTARAGYDLAVTRAPEENLRSAPAGALVGKLPQGFLLNRVAEATTDRWVHVTRSGWVEQGDVEPVPQAGEVSATPGHVTGVSPPDTTPGAAPVDPSRLESARRTVLYRAPEGPPAGTLAPAAPLRVLGRSGEWTRVQLQGWVKSADHSPE